MRPDRVRRIGPSGFGWLDAGLMQKRWLPVLSTDELSVYAFLCLVADHQGVSWYRRGRMVEHMGIHDGELEAALGRLCELDLVAYQPYRAGAADGFHQVLSLPAGGPPSFGDQLSRLLAERIGR